MSIIGGWFAKVGNSGGHGYHSSTVSWRFASPVNISAQAAVGSFGGIDLTADVGFSAYVQDGQYHSLGDNRMGTWPHVLWLDRVTQVDISELSYDGFVRGTAVAYWWE